MRPVTKAPEESVGQSRHPAHLSCNGTPVAGRGMAELTPNGIFLCI